MAAHGVCNTLGIELILASQIAVVAEDTRFAQLEVARGIFPLGGATFRLPGRLGPVGMRYLRRAERFDAASALRLGLVSEVVPADAQLARAIELARLVVANAPLAVQAALASVRAAESAARDAARKILLESRERVMTSPDVAEGLVAFLERRAPVFRGALGQPPSPPQRLDSTPTRDPAQAATSASSGRTPGFARGLFPLGKTPARCGSPRPSFRRTSTRGS